MTEQTITPATDTAASVAAALERVEASEKLLGVRLDYMREMAEAGSPVLAKLQALSTLNRAEPASALPAEIRSFAVLGAVQHDDCGECVQIHINLDRAIGINPNLLQAALDRRLDLLPTPLALAWKFGHAVAANDPTMEDLRQELERLYGRAALMELSFALGAARFYPTVKRALGYALSCSLVQVKAA
ncbi:MAG TPA: hypothetical protein VF194_00295 [Ferrovibrio sp.]|uniref:hypothetical protein n=1 Tax=Ferrovibrio sp. TaxID=1917215 RepID=UPI002ED5272E